MSNRSYLTTHHGPEDIFHVSEQSGITSFEPRPPPREVPGLDYPVVWAVDESHLCNYMLPRDCPRVAYRAGPHSTQADISRFAGGDAGIHIIAVETLWLPVIRATQLSLYRFDPSGFEIQDPAAGYYVCRNTVAAIEEIIVTDLIKAIGSQGVELRTLDSLWELRECVIGSTLEYSIIRMRNATPHEGVARFHPLP